MLKVRVGLPCRTVLSVESKEQIINGLVRLANQVLKEKNKTFRRKKINLRAVEVFQPFVYH